MCRHKWLERLIRFRRRNVFAKTQELPSKNKKPGFLLGPLFAGSWDPIWLVDHVVEHDPTMLPVTCREQERLFTS